MVLDCRSVNFVKQVLIYVENRFLCSILSVICSIFFKLCMRVGIRKECYGIPYCLILSNNYIVMAIDLNFEQSLCP